MSDNYFDRQHKRTKIKIFIIALVALAIALLLMYVTYADSPAELPDQAALFPIVVATDYLATCDTQYVDAMPQFTKLRIDSLSDNAQATYLFSSGITYVWIACDSLGVFTAIVADEIGNELAVGIFIGRGESVADAIEALALDHLVRTNATYVDP